MADFGDLRYDRSPSFRDTATKNAIQDAIRAPLLAALATADVPGSPPKSMGLECDALAVDAAGHLVAMEIKPGSVSSLAWVSAQATVYARALQALGGH